MGAAEAKPIVPDRPFEKHGRKVSCLSHAFLPTSPSLHSKQSEYSAMCSHYASLSAASPAIRIPPRSSMTVLMQLILLQDWQRVLIRCMLFGRLEIAQPCHVTLYGETWCLYPLQLACALEPPPVVISTLLHHCPEVASQPVRWVDSKTMKKRRKRKHAARRTTHRHWDCLGRRRRCAYNKAAMDRRDDGDEDDRRCLLACGDGDNTNARRETSSCIESIEDDAIELRLMQWSPPRDECSMLSWELSIGDGYPANRPSNNIHSNGWVDRYEDIQEAPHHTAAEDHDCSDDDSFVLLQEHNSLLQSLEKENTILQLGNDGELYPMILSKSLETESTATSEGSSPHDPESVTAPIPIDAILQDAKEGSLLPIHLACLYQADSEVLRLLLDLHPQTSPIVGGMLPIHLLSANWRLPPIRHGSHKASMLSQALHVVVESDPAMLHCKSMRHGRTGLQYIAHGNLPREIKLACEAVLRGDTMDDADDGGGDTSTSESSDGLTDIPREVVFDKARRHSE